MPHKEIQLKPHKEIRGYVYRTDKEGQEVKDLGPQPSWEAIEKHLEEVGTESW